MFHVRVFILMVSFYFLHMTSRQLFCSFELFYLSYIKQHTNYFCILHQFDRSLFYPE